MTLKELIEKKNWNNQIELCIQKYNEKYYLTSSLEGFKKVFNKLKEIEPEELSECTIIIEKEINKDVKPHVCYYYPSIKDNKNQIECEYISFTEWKYILGMQIIQTDTIKKLSKIKIITILLWEMTFFGFTEKEIQKKIMYLSQF